MDPYSGRVGTEVEMSDRGAENMLTRIPLNIVVTATGQTTEGVLVAVMASDLEALEAEIKRLTIEVHKVHLARIEAQNPGIDIERVRAERG